MSFKAPEGKCEKNRSHKTTWCLSNQIRPKLNNLQTHSEFYGKTEFFAIRHRTTVMVKISSTMYFHLIAKNYFCYLLELNE